MFRALIKRDFYMNEQKLTIEKLSDYHNIISEIIRAIESNTNNLIAEGADKDFEKLLLDAMRQTILILQDSK
jgi:predicted house-cleaning noncanonical NTP pyrophosphatase (MazG superfamily)